MAPLEGQEREVERRKGQEEGIQKERRERAEITLKDVVDRLDGLREVLDKVYAPIMTMRVVNAAIGIVLTTVLLAGLALVVIKR